MIGAWGWLGVITEITLRVAAALGDRRCDGSHASASGPRLDIVVPVLMHPRIALAIETHASIRANDSQSRNFGDSMSRAALVTPPAAGDRSHGNAARRREDRARRVRSLRILSPGMPDVSHARGRERLAARTARPDGRARERHRSRPTTKRCARTSTGASAAEHARPRVRRACRMALCSRRRARRCATARPRPFGARVLLWVFAHRIAAAAGDGGRAAARGDADSDARREAARTTRLRDGDARELRLSARARGRTTRRATGRAASVALLRGCVMEGLFTGTNRATERVLTRERIPPCRPRRDRAAAARFTRTRAMSRRRGVWHARNIAAFERSGAEVIVVNAAGCGAMMKEYGHLLARRSGVERPGARDLRTGARRERAARGGGSGARWRDALLPRRVRRAMSPSARATRRVAAARGARGGAGLELVPLDGRISAAAARGSTTLSSPRCRTACSSASSTASARAARRSWRRVIQDASCRSAPDYFVTGCGRAWCIR